MSRFSIRPNLAAQGRYIAVYGHRRLAAVKALGREVLCVVASLTDDEALVAQGLENNPRNDLTFAEKALYAARLKDRRLKFSQIAAALDIHPTTVSQIIAIVEKLSEALILALWPRPLGIGRPRWTASCHRDRRSLRRLEKGRHRP